MHSALRRSEPLRGDLLHHDLLRRALLLALLLVSCLGASVLPASAADPRSPTGSWSAATPATIDQGELEALDVREPGASSEYDRDDFGPAWQDIDGNDCDTRNDILTRDLSGEEYESGTGDCEVIVGVLKDPYSGEVIDFEKSKGSSQIDIDHIVPLGAAWNAGASEWTDSKRLAYANDPEVLAAVNSSDNRSTSDSTIGEWLPENTEVTCQYASSYVSVSAKYDLSISPADDEVLEDLSAQCG